MKYIKFFILAMIDQGPPVRFITNILNRKMFGLFSKRSHLTMKGNPKVGYNTKKTATKSAAALGKKRGRYFSNYRCIFCGKYHIGANRYLDTKK